MFLTLKSQYSSNGQTNATSIGRYKSLRGKKNIRDLGRVIEYNGQTELDAWYEDHCNEIWGSDGTIYPPFQTKEETYRIFIPQMCLSMHAEYVQPSKFAGIKTNQYKLEYDVSKHGTPNCFCRELESDNCPPKGLLNLFPCNGAPIGISSPHFYDGIDHSITYIQYISFPMANVKIFTLLTYHILFVVDPSVLGKLDGLNPQKDKHANFIHFYQVHFLFSSFFDQSFKQTLMVAFSLLVHLFRLLFDHKSVFKSYQFQRFQ